MHPGEPTGTLEKRLVFAALLPLLAGILLQGAFAPESSLFGGFEIAGLVVGAVLVLIVLARHYGAPHPKRETKP